MRRYYLVSGPPEDLMVHGHYPTRAAALATGRRIRRPVAVVDAESVDPLDEAEIRRRVSALAAWDARLRWSLMVGDPDTIPVPTKGVDGA